MPDTAAPRGHNRPDCAQAAFDAFVRDEMPELLERSKRRYFGQPWRVLASAFDALFGFS